MSRPQLVTDREREELVRAMCLAGASSDQALRAFADMLPVLKRLAARHDDAAFLRGCENGTKYPWTS